MLLKFYIPISNVMIIKIPSRVVVLREHIFPFKISVLYIKYINKIALKRNCTLFFGALDIFFNKFYPVTHKRLCSNSTKPKNKNKHKNVVKLNLIHK